MKILVSMSELSVNCCGKGSVRFPFDLGVQERAWNNLVLSLLL